MEPRQKNANDHQELDALKLAIAQEVVSRFSAEEIRNKSLENLARWKGLGTWGPAYEEWHRILMSADDELLIATILARGDNGERLRQSMPYVGMLPQAVQERLREQILN